MKNENGVLYIVATPIGNLSDITIRALETLKAVDVILAEDTRNTLKLLNKFNISKHLISYHRHNEKTKTAELIERLKKGENIALVSDAGTPGICDPGELAIKSAIEAGIKVVPIPGACASIQALIGSGLDTSEFIFLGFLPTNKKNRKEKLEEIKNATKTVILYEAPHKIKETLIDLEKILEKRKLVIARELTKIHEEYIREDIHKILENVDNLKGEMIIVIEGGTKVEKNIFENMSLEEHYKYYEKKGFEKKEIIKKIAKDKKVPKNEIYKQFI